MKKSVTRIISALLIVGMFFSVTDIVPGSVSCAKTNIDPNAFYGCTSLKIVENNPSEDWVKRIASLNKVLATLYDMDNETIMNTQDIWWLREMTDDQWAYIKEKAEEITAGCNSQYDKAKAISKWIVENTEYDMEWRADHSKPIERNPYGVLAWKQSEHNGRKRCTDCVGYSSLTYAMMRTLNITCVLVYRRMTGDEKVNHAWNAVLCDGRWIWIDNTQTDEETNFFDPGTAGYVCDTDHLRADEINFIPVGEFKK